MVLSSCERVFVVTWSNALEFCRSILLPLMLVCTSSCAYKFSNLQLAAPRGAKTIAVGAIYDTSRHVFPHEYVWLNIQKQIAIGGKLLLTSKDRADLYLRCHVVQAEESPAGIVTNRKKDPKTRLNESLAIPEPFAMEDYSSYRKAGSYTQSQAFQLSMDIELWDLREGKMLYRKAYSGNTTYPVLSAGAVEYGFLKAEEKYEDSVKLVAERLSSSIIADLLSY